MIAVNILFEESCYMLRFFSACSTACGEREQDWLRDSRTAAGHATRRFDGIKEI